jgi:5'-3' exonuclease
MQVHLVDGTFELFRAYYGSPASTSSDGREVGAVRGLLRSLLALLGERDATHVAIAFDHVIESFRNELYPGYNTGEGMDPVLFAQFGLAEDACRALGLVTWPMVEFECDDALAAAAARFNLVPDVERVVICSPDKDLAQCVRGTRVVCLDRMRRKVLDEDGVVAKFGVKPLSMPDWLALVGDSADGYPGIPRWGAKSAAAVLAFYEHLDAIPTDSADWRVKVRGAAALAAELAARPAEARLYRQLATLRTDVPLAEPLAALRWRGPDEHALRALAARCREDDSLVERAARVAARP